MDGSPDAVLGVSPRASSNDIKRAFRAKARQTHPDHGGQRGEFEAVVAAFEQLRRRRPNPFAPAAPAAVWTRTVYDSPRHRPRRPRLRFDEVLRSAMTAAAGMGSPPCRGGAV